MSRILAVVSLVLLAWFSGLVAGQSNQSQSGSSPSQTANSLSLSLTTGSATITVATSISGQATQVVTVFPSIVRNVTYTITPTSSSAAPSNATASTTPSPTPDPHVLDTKIDPAFAVLGVILILTGLPSAFWGHKNRWTSFFLIGFYTLSLVCIVLIIKFGVLPAVHPPSKTVRGMFVLASTVAGFLGGGTAIFFWKATRYVIGAWGGLALGLFIQCFRNGGVIRAIGYRWILYIACGVIGFMLATLPKIHYHIVLISTAMVGATSFILGVDCFTTAGLKEFYLWNLGFPSMFPKYTSHNIQFPLTQQMEIELGLIGAVALMGAAVQLRVLSVLQRKMREIANEAKRQDEEAELKAADKVHELARERDEWEKEHGGGFDFGKHGRQESNLSSLPLLNHQGGSTPTPDEKVDDSRRRNVSGLSDFRAAPTSDEDLKRATRHLQRPGSLPALDLGLGIEDEVPSTYIAKDVAGTSNDLESLKRKKELLTEIQTLRRSIDVLKAETPSPSSAEASRRPSLTSRRTLSFGADNALLPSHARPPRGMEPRARVQSLELSSILPPEPISRPNSAPLKDADWDNYIQERKLLQPPSGVTPPIATTGPINPTPRVAVAPAVQEALQRRQQRESIIASGGNGNSSASSEDVPLVRYIQQQQQQSPLAPKANNVPITILPPKRASGPIVAPIPQPSRLRTFEELNERHREKMRDLQAPLTQATREHADVEAAKQRWERAKVREKEDVTRRQAEKAAALEKDRKKKASSPDSGRSPHQAEHRNSYLGQTSGDHNTRDSRAGRKSGHSRSLSAEVLGGNSGQGSRRLSVMKVEDWQRYQEQERPGHGVPFPQPTQSRRKSRDNLN